VLAAIIIRSSTIVGLMMEAASTSETSGNFYQITRRKNQVMFVFSLQNIT
jgi:hypothetical protein